MCALGKKRVVLATFGTLGDLHPYIAIALELKAHGHFPVIATSERYRKKIEALGIGFAPVRSPLPDVDDPGARKVIERIIDPRGGGKVLFGELIVPAVAEAYEDLKTATSGADGLVTHPITFAGPVLAQKTGIPWVSTQLAPVSLWSNYDPPVLPPDLPWIHSVLKVAGPRATGAFKKLAELYTDRWFKGLYDLRKELGLPRGGHPLFDGQYSPLLNLGLFSPVLAEPQPDWPPNTLLTGFCFYDKKDQTPTSRELHRFLQAGEAPIVFTLGSSAVHVPGRFFEESVEAAKMLNRRAILLIGEGERAPKNLPPEIATFDYIPYSEIFSEALAVVHQGGIGTTSYMLGAGIPGVIAGQVFDQVDNGNNIQKIGVGKSMPWKKYTAQRVAKVINELLEDPRYRQKAQAVGAKVRAENGPKTAVDAILRAFGP